DRGTAPEASLAVPLRGDLLDRGDHRSARHPAAALRVRQPRRPAPRARSVASSNAPLIRARGRRRPRRLRRVPALDLSVGEEFSTACIFALDRFFGERRRLSARPCESPPSGPQEPGDAAVKRAAPAKPPTAP